MLFLLIEYKMSHYQLDTRDGFKSVVIFTDQSLGIGSYGMVCKALCDNLPCAAKLLHPIIISERNVKLFRKECQMLSRMKHPNIIRYLGTHQKGTQVLLMELMEQNLTSFLERSSTSLPLHTEVNLCHSIALALEYLHSNDIVHRDLSSNNVLLSEGGRTAKVTDFGMARLISTCNDTPLLTQAPGCSLYMPPEALSDPPVYTERIDIFSFGVLTIQILTRLTPSPGPARRKIKDPNYLVPIELPICDVERRKNHIDLICGTHPLQAIALECLRYEEKKRPAALALCQLLSNIKTSALYLDSANITVCAKDLQEAVQPTLPEIDGHSHTEAGIPLGPLEVKGCGDHSQNSQPNAAVAMPKLVKEQSEEETPEPFQMKTVEHLRLGKEHDPPVLLRMPLIAEPKPPSLAEQMCANSRLISCGSPSLYQIPACLVLSIRDMHIEKYDIGMKSVHDPAPGHVLMVVGAKGAGKTALINVLTNHIFGVHMDDPFRLILDSNKEETSWIRAYTFHRMKESPLPFTLTVVDTPVFGDLSQNRKLAGVIKELFSTSGPLGVDRFHGIWIVVNENTMPMQKQIAQAMNFCFVADYSSNVFIGVTRMPSDSTNPSVVETSEWNGVPVDRINTFDIPVMFKSNASSATSEDSLLWKREAHKFEVFIKQIGKMEGRSLLLGTDVLAVIRKSEVSVKILWHQIQAGLIEMSILHQVMQTQTANKDVSDQVTIPEWHTVPLTRGQMAMNCQRCKMTCHFPCHALSNAERDECCVMVSKLMISDLGECFACCECGCLASDHSVSSNRYVLTERGMTSNIFVKLFQSTEVQLSELQLSVSEMIIQVYCYIRHFDDIALKINPIASDEYLDLLIQSEEQEALPGHAIRVAYLEQIKKEVHFQSAAKIKAVQKDKLSKQEESVEESRLQREAMRAFVQLLDVNYCR